MITQEHPVYGNATGSNTYYIIGRSHEENEKELEEFIKEHGTKDNEIWVHRERRPRPSKVNLRPKYTMQIEIMHKVRRGILMFGFHCVWGK